MATTEALAIVTGPGKRAFSRALGADLLVMGYGHSRLREFVVGGVTRALSRDVAVPVLMSH